MIYINRQSVAIPAVFSSKKLEIAKKSVEDFYKRSKNSRSQEKFVKPFEQEIKDGFFIPLRQLFNGKCAYCESEISSDLSNTYDHFRPKNGARGLEQEFSDEHYWWLTYEWNNIYFVCKICNRYKSTWFPIDGTRVKTRTPYEKTVEEEKPLLIDPCHDRPEEHLIFKENGEVDFLSPKGKITIEILKLNRTELIEARESMLKDLFGVWEEFLKKWRKAETNWSRIQEIAKDWAAILNTTSARPFIAAQRQMLSKWINNHPEIQEMFAKEQYNFVLKTKVFSTEPQQLKVIEELPEDEKKSIEETAKIKSLKHVYLDRIELKNFKCFSYLEIKFDSNEGVKVKNEKGDQLNSEPWLLFLGENGVGKSSVLKAIAIALMGNYYRKKLRDDVSAQQLLKHGTNSGFIKLYLKGQNNAVEVHFTSDKSELVCTNQDPISYLVGYGSIRLLPNKKIQPEKGVFQIVKAGNLFDYSIALADAANWLLNLGNQDFDMAAMTLKDLMLLDQTDILERDKTRKTISVTSEKSLPVRINELSDGYQTVFALAVDIMSTLAAEKVRYDLAEGIVLIDEIGTHLHPRWKMKVVQKLRTCFPRIQFIVTTHEPLCLRGLKAGETIVLTKNNDKEIVALTDLPDPSELRVDQILTSEFFGLKSTIDPITEAIFDEYYSILAIEENERSDIQKNRLLVLNESIPKMKHLGDSLREELVYYVIDELLAKKSKTEGPKIREDLRKEAISRVESLWKML